MHFARSPVLHCADDRSPFGGHTHPLHPRTKRQPQRPLNGLDIRKTRSLQQVMSFPCRPVAHMRGIAQQFHGLQVGINQRIFVPENIDDEQVASRFENTPHFLQ